MCTMNKQIHIPILVAVPSFSPHWVEAEAVMLRDHCFCLSLFQPLPKGVGKGLQAAMPTQSPQDPI